MGFQQKFKSLNGVNNVNMHIIQKKKCKCFETNKGTAECKALLKCQMNLISIARERERKRKREREKKAGA